MRNECVIIDKNNMERFNRCDYCNTREHIDTQGIVSVDPKYDDLWFCSSNCLYNKKHLQNKTKKNENTNKHVKKNKHM